MKEDTDCGKCGKEFVAIQWTNGVCPHCGAKYSWDYYSPEDNSDEYPLVIFS